MTKSEEILWEALFAASCALDEIGALINEHPDVAKRDARKHHNRAYKVLIRFQHKEAASA